ncbi:hypothetical protein Sm713_39260 [Streptomyces sp. TS71-3]|nr:hypothetical protein Sm713_39260 [Streptomyces sp. TS71-3]
MAPIRDDWRSPSGTTAAAVRPGRPPPSVRNDRCRPPAGRPPPAPGRWTAPAVTSAVSAPTPVALALTLAGRTRRSRWKREPGPRAYTENAFVHAGAVPVIRQSAK